MDTLHRSPSEFNTTTGIVTRNINTEILLQDQLDTINSLLDNLGVSLEVIREGARILLRQKFSSKIKKQKIKKEPFDTTLPAGAGPLISPAKIKKEKFEQQQSICGSTPGSTSSLFPLVQSGSLLKCPHQQCNFCALSESEIVGHIAKCPHGIKENNANDGGENHEAEGLLQVNIDVKPSLKREPLANIKQETVDPLKEEIKTANDEDVDDVDSCSDVLSVSDASEINKENHVCGEPRCSYSTNSLSSFKAHLIMHQRKDVLKDVKKTCPVCQLSFKTLFKFKEHLLNHATKVSSSKVKCHVNNCESVVESSDLYDHVLFGHFSDQYKLKCDQCDFRTTTTSKLKTHLMVHLDERPFKCPDCDKSFRNKVQFSEHSNNVHKQEQKHSCSECCVSFSTSSQLSKHQKAKHSNKKFQCHHCDKTFPSSSSLKAHFNRVHNNEKQRTVCHVCGTLHGVCKCGQVKSPEKTDKASCPVCGKQMLAKNLSSHLHYHKQSSLRPFICQQCSQTFTHASSLKRHALLHTGEKQFKCLIDNCGKEFFQKVAYETHCRSHTNERLHCKGCNLPFLTKYLLNFHLKSKPECKKM